MKNYVELTARLDQIEADVEREAERSEGVAAEQQRITRRVEQLENSLINRNATTEYVLKSIRLGRHNQEV